MLLEAAALAFMVGDFIYHRWIEDHPEKPRARQEVMIPHADDGAPVPLIYGRVRVRNPICAWNSAPIFDSVNGYAMNMFFVLGIPMDDGNGINRIHNMWAGDYKLGGVSDLGLMPGDGTAPAFAEMHTPTIAGGTLGDGWLEFLAGGPTQELVDASGTGRRFAGIVMMSGLAGGGALNFNSIPGYRGYMSAFLFYPLGAVGGWFYGNSSSVPPYSFEASSYRDGGGYPAVGIYAQVGLDSNPINVLWDLYKAKFGKIGYDVANYIDLPSWQAAAYTLYVEGHGYSRYISNAAQLEDHIQEVLRQIDGALRENPKTGKIEIKLIRADYDPATIPHITVDNCERLTNFASGGWTNIVNRVRLVYTNRSRDYVDDSELAQNQANSVGQNGQVNEQTLQMPGVTEQTLAATVSGRELAARSRPVVKCRAIVGREFLSVLQGDAVKVTWTNPDIAGQVFRVANVERGTVTDGKIALDLISDYFYSPPNKGPDKKVWHEPRVH